MYRIYNLDLAAIVILIALLTALIYLYTTTVRHKIETQTSSGGHGGHGGGFTGSSGTHHTGHSGRI